ncbi:peroxiredoxin/DNA-binding transcriptional MerR regulator [Psychromicrobium silvestre]|uniref:Peroxiredoxin/DNA-binding transcriptional MerR regulator n=1 Tax=Psychromicrobium silvestre TaxID=1645614 RepID=A0A7Y9LSJ7_9MICC|nr:MerR family transcriptional regulator [Psychromicrobium silvestre]NYE94824.1 peroxiredoxin/DNA-binding transcriptional MerR regulator [Psychromicrobium silvestre]
MLAQELARKLAISVKALRYFEDRGLIDPPRLDNGYRDYSEQDQAAIQHILELRALGFSVEGTRPFIDCLRLGHQQGDDCLDSLAAYQREIDRIDETIAQLRQNRELLRERLFTAAARGFPLDQHDHSSQQEEDNEMSSGHDYEKLPPNLPAPQDDGQAAHLPGLALPGLTLESTGLTPVSLSGMGEQRWVLFIYPTTGVPGTDMPLGWNEIPGARGCTPEACGFRDNLEELRAAGASAIYGLSGQGKDYQSELVTRLHLPYELLSDPQLRLGHELSLPTFQAEGRPYYKRLTMVLSGQRIEHVFYPIFPPDEHAAQVRDWLLANPVSPVSP